MMPEYFPGPWIMFLLLSSLEKQLTRRDYTLPVPIAEWISGLQSGHRLKQRPEG